MANTKIPVELSSTPGIVDNSNATAITIDSSENVGIGTSSPSAFLHTEGTSIGTESYAKFSTGSAAGDQILTVKSGSSRDHMALQVNSGSGAVDDLALNPDGGNVGIGTTSPNAKLDILGTTSDQLRLRTAESEEYKIGRNASTGLLDFSGTQTGYTGYTFGGVDGERMRIDGSGNVGIGTSSPTRLLDVQRSTIGDVASFRGSDAARELVITSSTTTSTGDTYTLNANSGNGVIAIATGSSERMRIDSSGNVGIGTTSPNSLIEAKSTAPALRLTDSTDNSYTRLRYEGAAFLIEVDDASGANSSNFRIQVDGTETMRIDSSGLVGIGTSSPASLLHIKKTGFTRGTFEADGDNQTGIQIKRSNSSNNTDWEIYSPSIDTDLRFYNGGDRLTIDSSGNVGIGTTSPSYALDVYDVGEAWIRADSSHTTESTANSGLRFAHGGVNHAVLYHRGSDDALVYFDNIASSTHFQIDSSGNVGIGETSLTAKLHIKADGSSLLPLRINNTASGTASSNQVIFQRNGTNVGYIASTGSSTSYNTSSDARLKDITGSARGLEVINELNPVSYNWKVDGKADEGLIAQEVMEIVPNAVSGSEEKYYQMDYSKLVVHLVKGMKEQQEQIEALQSEINELKNS